MGNNWRIGEITHIVMKQGDSRTLAVGFTNFSTAIIHAVKLSIGATDSFNDPICFIGERRLIVKKADLNVNPNERITITIPLGNYDIKSVDLKIEQIVYSTGEIIDLTEDIADFSVTEESITEYGTNNDENLQPNTCHNLYTQECTQGSDSEMYSKRTQTRARLYRSQNRSSSCTLRFCVIFLLIAFYPLGLVIMWDKKVFSTPVRISLTTIFALFFMGRLGTTYQRHQQYDTASTFTTVGTMDESSSTEEIKSSTDSEESGETSENTGDAATTDEPNDKTVSYSEDGTEYAILYDGRNDEGSGRIDIYAKVSRDDPEMKAHVENVLYVFYDACAVNKENSPILYVIIYVYNTIDDYKKDGIVQGQYCVAYWTTEEKDAITWMPKGTGVGVEADTEAWIH